MPALTCSIGSTVRHSLGSSASGTASGGTFGSPPFCVSLGRYRSTGSLFGCFKASSAALSFG